MQGTKTIEPIKKAERQYDERTYTETQRRAKDRARIQNRASERNIKHAWAAAS